MVLVVHSVTCTVFFMSVKLPYRVFHGPIATYVTAVTDRIPTVCVSYITEVVQLLIGYPDVIEVSNTLILLL